MNNVLPLPLRRKKKCQADKNPKRIASGRRNVEARADYQSAIDRLAPTTVIREGVSHDQKMHVYRRKVLDALVPCCSQEHRAHFDRESLDWLGSVTPNTEIALYSDLLAYVQCCAAEGIAPLPIAAHTVDFYLSHLMAQGRKRATVDRHLASLVRWCDWLEYDDPRRSKVIKQRLGKLRQALKKQQRQAAGFRADHLNLALSVLDPDRPRDCLDAALLFVAYQTMCRESELVSFDWEDLSHEPDFSGRIHLASSKTDQDGEGEMLYLSPTTMQILNTWQSLTGKTTGPLFRGIYSDGKLGGRLSVRAVQRSFKRTAARLGENPTIYSGHSTRVGSAQDMLERDFDMASIMVSGRWKSVGMLVKYTQRQRAGKSAAARLSKQLGWAAQKGPEPVTLPLDLMLYEAVNNEVNE